MTAPTTGKDVAAAESVDLTAIQAAFASALDGLMGLWRGIKSTWSQWFTAEVGRVLHAGDTAALGQLALPSRTRAQQLVTSAMASFADTSAGLVAAELAVQGNHAVDQQFPPDAELAADAEVTTTLLAGSLGQSAGSEAARVHGPNSSVAATQQQVANYLASLTDAQPAYMLGGALHGAGNRARILTLLGVPDIALYASEVMDTNTCEPCDEVHGAYLGGTRTGDISRVYEFYPVRGYVDCLGRNRCRGTVVGVWGKDGS